MLPSKDLARAMLARRAEKLLLDLNNLKEKAEKNLIRCQIHAGWGRVCVCVLVHA